MSVLVHQSTTTRFIAPPALFTEWLHTLRLWRRRIHERQALALMSQRDLRDISVSSSELWNEIRKPFWL